MTDLMVRVRPAAVLPTPTAGRLIFKQNYRTTEIMKKSNKNVVRKRPGRPATGQDPVTAIRLSAGLRAAVDTWAEKQEDQPSRSEAIRRLVENALMHQALIPTGKPHKGAAKAKEMAKTFLNKRLADLPEAERLSRKGRLMKQPKSQE